MSNEPPFVMSIGILLFISAYTSLWFVCLLQDEALGYPLSCAFCASVVVYGHFLKATSSEQEQNNIKKEAKFPIVSHVFSGTFVH